MRLGWAQAEYGRCRVMKIVLTTGKVSSRGKSSIALKSGLLLSGLNGSISTILGQVS